MLEINKTEFDGLLLLKPKIHGDHRGHFLESYNQRDFSFQGISTAFIQDNQSYSKYGTLRGLHFQVGEFAQTKLIRVVQGRILDVVVDLRPRSQTFGKSYAAELSGDNFLQLFIPKGFAHGFVVLSESALVSYKCDAYYSPQNESGIYFGDADLAINWGVPADQIIASEKDRKNASFREVRNNEKLIGHGR